MSERVARGTISAGKARFERWLEGFIETEYGDSGDELLLLWWNFLPQAEKDQLKEMNPTSYEAIRKEVEGV